MILSKDAEQMKANAGTLNFILDAVSAPHDINSYLGLLKPDGTLVLVGAPMEPLPIVFQSYPGSKKFCRLTHRRHCRNARNAGLLQQTQHCGRY